MIRVGTSGWVYKHWTDVFYPEELKDADKLNFYASNFDTVEINSSFYHLPKESTFKHWADKVPDNFCYCVKGWGAITHKKRLKNCKEEIEVFLNRVNLLGKKLGVILWQLPPNLKYNPMVIQSFLTSLPIQYKYSIEVRHDSFVNADFFNQLKKANIAFCIADTPKFPYVEEITADFAYLRLHGREQLYASNYSYAELEDYAKKIMVWPKTTYVYFDNDYKGYAVKNALELKSIIAKMKKD